MSDALRIGVDLGGTKIEVAALDAAGRPRWRRRVATPRDDFDATVGAIVGLVETLERELGQRGTVGIGTPGAVSPATGVMKNANSTWLNGRRLEEALVAALRRPVRLANDANCLALSEAVDGGAAGAHVVFGVILGTGVGGGVVVNGRVLTGANAIAGEWGHNSLPWPEDDERPGPPCYCGRLGCIETFLAGPALERQYEAATGVGVPAADIARRADDGDAAAEAVLARYEHRLARALASVINVLDPDVIVLAGGVSNIARLAARVPGLWGPFVFSDRVATRLVTARHGDSSGVRGAARLWDGA
jgi:fructokinase